MWGIEREGRDRGRGERTWFRGNPGSPGIAKLLSSAMFWTSFCASLPDRRISIFIHPLILQLPIPTLIPNLVPILTSHLSKSNSPQSETTSNIPSRHPRSHLPQTLANPQDPINQQPVRRALDLEIPEERIRAEQAQHLVQRIVALVIGLRG
jgi:hypothetical protein